MGDRTQVSCTIGNKDLLRLFGNSWYQVMTEQFFFDEAKKHNGYVEFSCDEANYGGYEILEKIQDLNVPFIFIWGKGQEYQSGSVVSDGNKSYEVVLNDYEPIVMATSSREFIKLSEIMRRYKEMVKKLLSDWNSNG